MPSDRYAITAEIRTAVEGHEESVLDDLSIPHRDGRPHITCPYPSHGGADDWRWDTRRSRAFCTCTKSDSIFDVVMKCEGIEFDEAKVRVAEAIGRSDLIKTRSDDRGERDAENQFQKTTAAGLMSVKAEFRDDALVANYLAYRLGIADDEVLLPSTPVRGITHGAYWEAGTGRGKPKSVGSFPSIVFRTLAADRKTHAHRIYVAPNGRGKADLGTSGGRPRNPKKSAKVEGDDNTAGRSVFWGDPTKAPHIVITEGIETGAAVAQAFRAEIKSDEICVAAAISANGVEAFQPWPPTKRITVAADRDDAEKRGKSGSQRGEQAARKLGLRHHQNIKLAIALPGLAGQSLDWLDVFVDEGTEAVRTGIMAAEIYKPTAEEIEEKRKSVDREAEIAEANLTYPLPSMSTKQLVYAHDENDRVRVHKVAMVKDPLSKIEREVVVPIMTPMGVAARLRHIDQDDAYSLRIVVQDMNGRPRNLDIARRDLAKMNGAEIKSMLLGVGLRVEDDGEAAAVAMLKAADPTDEILIVRYPAWHQIGQDQAFFVTPGGTVIGAPDEMMVELDVNGRLAPDIVSGGSLEGWKAAVAAALAQTECPHWALGVMAGFAGPLIAMTGMDTCGINLSGRSSSGKSTAQKLAVSAWTVPDTTKPGLARSARTTANAVESLSQQANGTILSLDELAHVSGKEMGRMIYTIAGGVGKARLRADASLRDASRWSTFAILSAESSLQEKIEADGETFMAGMAARIPDIDVSGIDRNVDKAAMDRIEAVSRNFGHAGPAFVESLIREGLHLRAGELRESINKRAIVLAGGEKADSALIRAALPFAILAAAGKQAQRAGLLPAEIDLMHAIGWAWGRFNQSADADVLNPVDQVFASLRLWISERWGVSIRDVEHTVGNQNAVAWFDADAVYIPRDRIRDAAGGALKEQEIAAALSEAGHLYKREDAKRPYVRHVPKLGKINAYALRRPAFGRSGLMADPDGFKVYEGGRTT